MDTVIQNSRSRKTTQHLNVFCIPIPNILAIFQSLVLAKMYEIPTKSKLAKLLKISPVVPGTHLNGRCCKKAYGKIRSVQLFFTQKCLVKDIRKKTYM